MAKSLSFVAGRWNGNIPEIEPFCSSLHVSANGNVTAAVTVDEIKDVTQTAQRYCASCEVLERYEHSRDHRRTVRLPLRRKRRPFTQDVCGCHRGLDSEWVGHASNVNFLTPSEKGRRPTFCRPAKAGVKRQATRQAVSGRYRAGLTRRTIPKRTVHHLLGSEPPERYV